MPQNDLKVVSLNLFHSCNSLLTDFVKYVGNLDPSVTEAVLTSYFQTFGQVSFAKILVDKNNDNTCFGFVEYLHHEDAKQAISQSDGQYLLRKKIKVGWAIESQAAKEGYHLFVGDISSEITSEQLNSTFSQYPSLT